MTIDTKKSLTKEISLIREIFGKKIYFLTQCSKNPQESPERQALARHIISFMKMKVQHTMFVHKEGMNILEQIKEIAVNQPQDTALTDLSLGEITYSDTYSLITKYLLSYNKALFWHDLGRVAEFNDNLEVQSVDHAEISKQIVQEHEKDILTILAVRNHGYPTNKQMYIECSKSEIFNLLSDEEKKACLIISLLVRDADKLGNWKAFAQQGINRVITKKIKPDIFRDCVSIGTYEMDCLKNNQPINYSLYSNFSGVQVAHLTWSADIAFKATKNAAIKGNFVKEMITYMDEVAQDDTAAKIKNAPYEALQDYMILLKQETDIFNLFKERGWIAKNDIFNAIERLENFQKRLKSKNYETFRVLTNGMKRYNKISF